MSDPIPVTTELYYDAGTGVGPDWHPAPVYVRDMISITRGQADESRQPRPANATATIDNRTTDYNPRNPLSSLYGKIGRNTPIRFGVSRFGDDFNRDVAEGWGFTPDGRQWLMFGAGGTIALADTLVTGGQGRHFVPAANAYRVTWLPDVSLRDVEMRTTVDTFISGVAGGPIEPAGLLLRMQDIVTYYMARVEISASEAVSIALYGPSGLLASAALPLAWSGQPLTMCAAITGPVLSASVWDPAVTGEPLVWQVQAVDTQIPGPGAIGIRSGVAGGNTNTKPLEFRYDDLVVVDRRAVLEVASWRPSRTVDFDPATGRGDAWTAIEAAGILRRLGQGADPIVSPLRRAIGDATPTAYWPLEDGPGSTSAASAVDGVTDMTPFGFSRFQAPGTGAPVPAAGLPEFGSGTGIPGSAPVVDLSRGGVLQAPVPPGDGTSWRVEWVMVAPRDKAASVIPLRIIGSGTYDSWTVTVQASGVLVTIGTLATGISVASGSQPFTVFDGQPHLYALEAFDLGAGQFGATLTVDDEQVAITAFTPPLAGTPGSVAQVIVNPLEIRQDEAASASMPIIGHVAVWNPTPPVPVDLRPAARGHAGENTATRFTRLCAEQGIPALVVGDPADTPTMGPQRVAPLRELLAELVRTDDGIIYEPRDWLGLVLRSGASLAGQPTALTVDWTAGQVAPPLDPVVDDLNTRNDITAASPTGSYRAVLESGRMSVLPPPDGVGRVTDRIDINPASDTDLPNHATWRLHVGTVDEVRLAAFTVDLVASPELADAAAAVDVGDRALPTGLPVDVAPGQAAMLTLGTVEELGSHTRRVTVTGAPSSPYDQVAVADGAAPVPADGSTLATGITATATLVTIASTPANGPWTEDPADLPLDVRVGGEQVTLSAIYPAAADVYGRTLTSGWGTATTQQVWTTSGGTASDYSVLGG